MRENRCMSRGSSYTTANTARKTKGRNYELRKWKPLHIYIQYGVRMTPYTIHLESPINT